MALNRGIARFRGEQLNDKIMRNRHFDEGNKINERFLDIDFNAHRESLQDTKIDVWSQINNLIVDGVSSKVIDELQGLAVAQPNTEGVVLEQKVEVRLHGTEDTAQKDEDADRVYGRLVESNGIFTLFFYSMEHGTEQPYTFDDADSYVDIRYALRTNLAVIPVDSLLNGGSGFVEGATDARAYMNILQLAKDLYGSSFSLDNDGNPNLPKDIVTQLAELNDALSDALQEFKDDLASDGGAELVGVADDAHYKSTTVQAVLSELARYIYILQVEDQEEIYEAVGGETGYTFTEGSARLGSVMVFINGQLQTPTINFTYTIDDNDSNLVTGIDFTPDTLKVVEGTPDVLYVRYKKVITP